jgi:hypothetical protein
MSAGAGNGTYSSLNDGVLNDSGRVAFQGSTSTVDRFMAVARPEAAHLAAREGLAAPDMPAGVTFDNLFNLATIRLNNDGQIAFTGEVEGPGISSVNDFGIWAGSSGNLQVIARTNDIAVGTGGQRYELIDEDVGFANGGYVAFHGELENTNTGIWAGTKNNLQLVALEGGPAPGVAGGVFGLFTSFNDHAAINRLGQIAIYGLAEVGAGSNFGIWSGTPGNLQRIAYEGMPMPSFGSGASIITFIAPPQVDDANTVGFSASMSTTSAQANAIFLKSGSAYTPVYGLNEVPPGYSTGTKFGIQLDFHFGGQGKVAFLNSVDLVGPSYEDAIFAYDNGAKRRIARIGDQIPNTTQDRHFTFFERYYINEQGRVAFMADFGGVESGTGIWAENEFGQLVEIVRTDVPIEIAPGDVRTPAYIDWPGSNIGHSPLLPYNSSGQILFDFFDDITSDSVLVLYTPPLVGDYNGNGVVDAADYVVWRKTVNQSGPNLAADGNNDNQVNGTDYQIWRSRFGQLGVSGAGASAYSSFAVPEPTTAVLGILAVATLFWAVRRRAGSQPEFA